MNAFEEDLIYEPGREYSQEELKALIESGLLPESYFYGDDNYEDDDWIENED